jgi:hypothetical protein
MATTAFNDLASAAKKGGNEPKYKGGLHSGDDGNRYSGGSGGPEHRHHFPAADAMRKEDATRGKVVKSALHGDVPAEPGAMVNTTDGARGTIMGASHPNDKWRKGF